MEAYVVRQYCFIMASNMRRSLKDLLRFQGTVKPEPTRMLERRPAVNSLNSLSGGFYKVGFRYSKPELNIKGVVHFPVCNAVFIRSLGIDAAPRNERPEEREEAPQKPKEKRRKLKGRRAVAKWLKFFRWKKKKEYERMTPEEKLMYKLKKPYTEISISGVACTQQPADNAITKCTPAVQDASQVSNSINAIKSSAYTQAL